MKIIITGRNVDLTGAIKDRANDKLSKLDKFFTNETAATVTLKKENVNHNCRGGYYPPLHYYQLLNPQTSHFIYRLIIILNKSKLLKLAQHTLSLLSLLLVLHYK